MVRLLQKGEWGGVFGVWCLVPGITGPNTKLQTPNSKRLVVIWRAAMTRGQMAAVLQLLGLRHYFRRPRRPLQVYLAASFGHCRAVWRQVLAAVGLSGGNWLLQGCLAASLAAAGLSGGCRSIWRQVLAAAGPLQGRYTRPSFNDAAAVEYSLCYLQVMLLLF